MGGEEHPDRRGHQPAPTVPARIVADLLGDQAADHRRPEVDLLRTAGACGTQVRGHLVQRLPGQRVGGLGGLETGDGAEEEQLVARRVLDAEVEEQLGTGAQQFGRLRPRAHAGGREAAPAQQLGVAVGEHRVVEGVLAGEVDVERGRAHAHRLRDVAQRPAAEPLLPGQPPRGVDDLPLRGGVALGPPVRSAHDTEPNRLRNSS